MTTTTPNPVVMAEDVTCTLGGKRILDGVSLEVAPGEVVVLVGPSGAGKTTFLRTMNGLEPIDGGDLMIAGDPMGYQLDKAGRRKELESLLQEFHINHIRDNLGMSLSGGERRRVEIARALATAPKFILLDEPFAGVDPISVGDIKQIIHHLKAKGIGVLITDHNVRETLDICETAYIVNDGQLIAEGDAETILANELVKEVYLGHEFRL